MLRRRAVRADAAVAALVAFCASGLGAQGSRIAPKSPWADSTPTRIMSLGRGGIPISVVLEVLRQRHQAYSEGKRHELAESVVSRAIQDPRVGTSAIDAISISGAADPGLGGTPDPEALDRLIRISRGATSAEERHFALEQLVTQVNPARALPYLREVATSQDSTTAFFAVATIVRLGFSRTVFSSAADRTAAQAVARDLFDNNLIKSTPVLAFLCDVARGAKWPSGGRCKGIV